MNINDNINIDGNININDNINNAGDVNKTIKYVNNLYDGLSYYDLYGGSVFLFFIITMIVFCVWAYCSAMQTKEQIASDWVNQRCKPQNMPFAGWITKPDGKTSFEYTGENFQYCLNNILVNITGSLVQPFTYLINSLQGTFNMIGDAINSIRNFMNILRSKITEFTSEILGRILNMLIPFQTIIIAITDTFAKTQATLTAGLYTALGSYYTLKSLLGSIIELIIKVMIACALIILALWAGFFTIPLAIPLTVVYTVIAIVVTILIISLKDMIQLQSSAVPKVRCFDKHTILVMENGLDKEIQHIEVGDKLENGILVTAKIRIDAKDLRMFNLYNIIVSESHVVNYNCKWIPIREHPEAVEVFNYLEPELYCLNTSSKEIVIIGKQNGKQLRFTDWDEIYDETLNTILNHSICVDNKPTQQIYSADRIDELLFVGFNSETKIDLVNVKKRIDKLEIGDKLSGGGIVYGIVELYKNNLGDNVKMFHLLTSNGKFIINGNLYMDYNDRIDSILQ